MRWRRPRDVDRRVTIPPLDRRGFLSGAAATLLAAPVAGAGGGWPRAPVEIVDDRHGVPHVRARSAADAFFGHGYVVARDRLFQIDLAHRATTGRMAEAFGAGFVQHDVAARLFHYRGDLAAEWRRIPPAVRAGAEGWVAGVNARIAEVLADPALRPREYAILNVVPLRWDIHDLMVARGAAAGDVDDAIRRAQLAALGLLDLDALVAPLRPATTLRVPPGLDVAAVGEADLGVLRPGALPFGADTPTRTERANAGSNAWTIEPSRSATGRAILANDPHLGIGGFPARHVAHLSAPGLDVIGAAAPGLPGIMQGHTDRFAFGRTNFHIDQNDLFVLDLHPHDPERYRHAGGWKRFERVDVAIPVRDAAPQVATLRYAVQGPVVSHDPARRRATALASVAMQPGGSTAFAMIAINLARDWVELRAAFRLHPLPTNFHYADVDGNHGWHAIGFTPQRRRGDGLLPAPGDGSHDWTGLRDHRALPSAYNPVAGWFASANQDNLPPGWPATAHSFREPWRYDRIAAVLAAQPRHALADSVALQHDTLSLPARRVQALLGDRDGPAAALLRGWDARIDAGSAAAALFEILWRDLEARLLALLVPERARTLVTELAASALLERLPDHPAVLDAALASAWPRANALLGPDPTRWRWDTLHRVRVAHPLARIPAIAAAFPAIDGAGSGGDDHSVMARWLPGGDDWRTVGGAAYLQVIDVGDWDRSLMLNLPGQSGDPRSPHYRDHYAPWIAGAMQPLLFSRAAVEANATARTILNEARAPTTK
ncbi:MAG: penicillin acylase family protein [Sphingomonas taxi]|uniref:Penicillin acylase family protein n=1 Tax=Sphingomonas taxi TaxID=1549858 RepID=A0A2W5PBM2_9SPHN|nr:MAG: penicillin acylase family protein [Sphingomonas taxi]